MKKINMLKIIGYAALTVCASPTRAQVAADTSVKTVEFPFVRQRLQLQAQASVLLPALVGEQRFRNNLADDCRKFEESYNQYAVHIDELSRDLAGSARELPLGYTMKPQYELNVAVTLVSAAKPVDPAKWSLVSGRINLQFESDSMTSISKQIGLKPTDVEVDADTERNNVLALRSRDMACDLLSGRAQLIAAVSLDVQADERAALQARRLVQLWIDQVRASEQMDLKDRQKAAWLGFQFESLKKQAEAGGLAEYLNIHYFFETFFQPNQLILQPQWKSDFSRNWRKTIQVNLPIGVERL